MSASSVPDTVARDFEARTRAWEEERLSPLATPSYPAEREHAGGADCRLRTPFQRDRDRIVHSKAFRRLKHKTQVFIAPEGDHYRTRLTHTLEATQISRTVARALRLNEDLVGGDRARARPRAPAVRPHRRGRCSTPACASASAAASATTSTRCGSWTPGARRRAGSTSPTPVRDGILRHSSGARRAGDARGQDRPARRPHRLHQPRHRRRAAGRRAGRGGPAGRGDRGARRDGVRAHRHARARPRRALRGGRATSCRARRSATRCCGCARSCSTTSTWAEQARREHARIETVLRTLFDHYCTEPPELPVGVPGGVAAGARDRLPGGHDRPLLHPRLHRR